VTFSDKECWVCHTKENLVSAHSAVYCKKCLNEVEEKISKMND